MPYRKRPVSATLVSMFFALPQGAYATGCDDVYLNSTRNKYNNIEDFSSYNALYDQICTADGEKKSLSWDSSMSIIVDALPIKMTGNGKSAQEKASSFCHFYHSIRFDSSHSIITKDEVVVSALNSYNTCKEIEARTGVTISHKFADPDSIIVNFDFKNANTVLKIDGVVSRNMTCRANDAPKGQEKLTEKSNFEMRQNFAITCQRTHMKGKEDIYSPGSLAIGTNIDSYTISMPSDSIYNDSLASETGQRIAGLTKSLTETNAQLSDTQSKLSDANKAIGGLHMVQHRIMTGQYNPGGGFEFYGCGTKLDQVRDSLCKGAQQSMLTPAMKRGGDQCGYDSFVITCLYLGP